MSAQEVKLSRAERKRIRNVLRKTFGDNCCWCGKVMLFPEYGKPLEDIENMATIEHYFAIQQGEPDNIMFLRLSHKRCNH